MITIMKYDRSQAVKVDEHQVQHLIHTVRFASGDRLIVPNVSFPWECDVVSVTKSGYAYEFEIKLTRADFKNDFKKEKHQYARGEKPYTWKSARPSYFSFVVPRGMVAEEELPDYAGLYYISDNGKFLTLVRKPKLLHKEKVSHVSQLQLLRSMMYRYWTVRKQLRRQYQTSLAI